MNKNIKNLFLIILITIGLILPLEISFKIIYWSKFSPYHTNQANQSQARWVSDKTLFWTNRPFFLEYDLRSQYNDVGIRVKPKDVFMPQKKQNDFWVFLFGGSAMAGMGSNKGGDWFKITGVNDHLINESIDGYLEVILQKAIPNKNVRVFNAAVSGHTISQSFNRYKILNKYNPDWVISMDGVNEPNNLSKNETIETYLTEEWKNNAAQNATLQRTFFLMQNSALCFKLSKFIYYLKEEKKTAGILDSIEIYRKKWFINKPNEIRLLNEEKKYVVQKSVAEYFKSLNNYEKYLTKVKQKHLLLIQPYIAFRDTNNIGNIEKAVYNYFTTTSMNNANSNSFLSALHTNFNTKNKHIYKMDAMHNWNNWVFVDYCHFTKETNEKIANEIAKYILTDGTYEPFKKNIKTAPPQVLNRIEK